MKICRRPDCPRDDAPGAPDTMIGCGVCDKKLEDDVCLCGAVEPEAHRGGCEEVGRDGY